MLNHSLHRYSVAASLSLAMLAGCAQPPSLPAQHTGTKTGTQTPMTAVQPSALTGIQDASKQAAAASLTTTLSADLRARATMSDAELLSNNAPSAAAYALISLDERAYALISVDASGTAATGDASASVTPTASASEDADRDAEHEKNATAAAAIAKNPGHAYGRDHDKLEQAAKAALDRLPAQAREAIKRALAQRDQLLKSKLARKLAEKQKKFQRHGSETTTANADGTKTVSSAFDVAGTDGSRSVSVSRTLAADGTLVQATQTLSGSANGATYSATRTRTVNADGSVTVTSDTKVTLNGKTQEISWTRTVKADGSFTGTGTLTKPDGTTVALSASGSEGGTETVSGQDAGVQVKLDSDDSTGTATASVDAGAAGHASLKVASDDDVADDDQPEADASGTAKLGDDGQNGRGDEHRSEQGNASRDAHASDRGKAASSGTRPAPDASGTPEVRPSRLPEKD